MTEYRQHILYKWGSKWITKLTVCRVAAKLGKQISFEINEDNKVQGFILLHAKCLPRSTSPHFPFPTDGSKCGLCATVFRYEPGGINMLRFPQQILHGISHQSNTSF